METDPKAELPKGIDRPKSLTKVLEQSEHVRELVKQSVTELSSANKVLEQELTDRNLLHGVGKALERIGAAEGKMQEAFEKLSDLNRALESEVRDRHLLDHQFAAVKEQEEAASHSAFHDGLTGLPNRALFNDRLEHGLTRATRHSWTFAVMFIDLDKFKIINDSHGHEAGDDVLKTIAQRLKENTRGGDTVSRHGGDEFLCLLMEIRDEQDIAMIAEKIIKAIEAPCNVTMRDTSISPSVSASIGISIFPKNGTTADTLVKSADKAMYRAKQSKSGYSFAL